MEVDFNILFFYLFVIILILCVATSFIIKKKNNIMNDYLDPFTIFTAGYFVYSVVGAYDHIFISRYSDYTKLIFYVTVIIGYLVFSLAYFSHRNYAIDETICNNSITFKFGQGIIKNGKITVMDFLMLCLFVLFIVLNLDKFLDMLLNFGYGASYVETSIRGDRTMISGPISLLNSYFILFMIGYPTYNMFKTNTITLIDIVIFVLVAVYSIASGHRATLLYVGLAWLVFFNYKFRLFKLRYLIFFGGIMLFFMTLLGNIRSQSSILGMLSMFSENGASYARLSSSGEFFNTVDTFFDYIEAIGNGSYSFNWGYTWLVDMLVFIPEFLFPGRPLPWAEQYMIDFQPLALSGTGHGWFVLNDGYMSFGIIGVMIEMYVMGYILARTYSYFMKKIGHPIVLLIYVIFLYHVFLIVRTGFLMIVKNFILESIPLLLIIFLSSKLRISK